MNSMQLKCFVCSFISFPSLQIVCHITNNKYNVCYYMLKEINSLLIVSNRQIIEFKNKFTIPFVIVQVIIDMQIQYYKP